MGSERGTVEFLVGQMASAGTITSKKMFGEYGVYCDGTLVALVCDDHLFVKPTAGGRAFAAGVAEGSPYPGAKPSLLVDPERWDDHAWLSEFISITKAELPPPKASTRAS